MKVPNRTEWKYRMYEKHTERNIENDRKPRIMLCARPVKIRRM